MRTVSILEAADLLAINRISQARGLERTLPDEVLLRLDAEAVALLWHHSPVGEGTVLRTNITCKLVGGEAPVDIWLDMPVEHFYNLPRVTVGA